jgi:putative PIN family toxin of toxin-antitoxin system
MSVPEKAVFDCNIYLQALGNKHGAAGQCLHAALAGQFLLFVDRPLLEELFEVVTRPTVARKLRVLPSAVEELREQLRAKAVLVDVVPCVFQYPRDPDDAHYVDLAVATDAMLIVSRDADLLDLMNDRNPDGVALRARYPDLRILTPPTFLNLLPRADES